MKLVQTRRCDGSCCRQAPRFPNADHSDCIYHKPGTAPEDGKETFGCMLMTGEATLAPDEQSVPYKGLDAQGVYEATCVEWPLLNSEPEPGNTGDCCWQWVPESSRRGD